jgi:hypothetical protein
MRMKRSADDHDAVLDDVIGRDDSIVHDWRVARLTRFGVPRTLAEAYADQIDWHEIATLVRRGCPPLLALRIVL